MTQNAATLLLAALGWLLPGCILPAGPEADGPDGVTSDGTTGRQVCATCDRRADSSPDGGSDALLAAVHQLSPRQGQPDSGLDAAAETVPESPPPANNGLDAAVERSEVSNPGGGLEGGVESPEAGSGGAANYAFVTSTTVVPGELSRVEGATGGLDGADRVCNRAAAAAGLPGTYVAWLSSSKVHALDRLSSARGWLRTDGVPFADRYDSLTNGANWVPLNRDENRVKVAESLVLTGTGSSGNGSSWTCADWSDTTASSPPANSTTGGSTSGVGRMWTSGYVPRCNESYRLYCFGVDRETPVSRQQAAGRQAFVSKELFFPGTGRDITDADDLCQDEADAAGLDGSYRAFLATSDTAASERFDLDGAMWVRVDGLAVGTFADLASGSLLTGIHVQADRRYSTHAVVFTGATGTNHPGDSSSTCDDWGSSTGNGQGGALLVPRSAFAGFTPSCRRGAVVYCFEQ